MRPAQGGLPLLLYVIFGKMGGLPEVKWGRYEDRVIHVRTSHVPRFELDMSQGSSLFQTFGVTYDEFRARDEKGKMHLIRQYAKKRLKEGEHLW